MECARLSVRKLSAPNDAGGGGEGVVSISTPVAGPCQSRRWRQVKNHLLPLLPGSLRSCCAPGHGKTLSGLNVDEYVCFLVISTQEGTRGGCGVGRSRVCISPYLNVLSRARQHESHHRPTISKTYRYAQLIERCWSAEPHLRPSAANLVDELDTLTADLKTKEAKGGKCTVM